MADEGSYYPHEDTALFRQAKNPVSYTHLKEQTEDFLNECIKPVLEKYADVESDKPEINV